MLSPFTERRVVHHRSAVEKPNTAARTDRRNNNIDHSLEVMTTQAANTSRVSKRRNPREVSSRTAPKRKNQQSPSMISSKKQRAMTSRGHLHMTEEEANSDTSGLVGDNAYTRTLEYSSDHHDTSEKPDTTILATGRIISIHSTL